MYFVVKNLILAADIGVCKWLYIENGLVKYNYSSGIFTTAKYTCKKGYDLMGNNDRKCIFNVDWTGRPPVCRGEFYL